MKIIVAGDFCSQHRVTDLFNKGDFASVLGEVRAVLEESDYAVVNFECPVCQGGEDPISKFGPNLQCVQRDMEAIKWAGFKCVTLANNHFLDYGTEGVANTLKSCKEMGIDSVGGGMNITEASQILYVDNVAIVNCCEHEFSIASDTSAGSNPLNPIKQHYAIQEARKLSENIPFARIDLYDTEKGVLFGEITFFPMSGMGLFKPQQWNDILGERIPI